MSLAQKIRAWRISPRGAGLSQPALAEKAGVSLTSIQPFEKTGAITLQNLMALMRALDLLEGLGLLVPDPERPTPMERLMEAKKKAKMTRQRAPRTLKTRE